MAKILLILFIFNCVAEENKIKFPPIQGSYNQIRTVPSLDIKMKSSGNYGYKNNVLLWNQKKPQEISYIVSNKKIVQKVNGLPDQVYDSESHPEIYSMIDILFSVIKGNEKKLKKSFDILAKKQKIILKPLESNMKKVINKIIILKDGYEINIYNKDNSHTLIEIKK